MVLTSATMLAKRLVTLPHWLMECPYIERICMYKRLYHIHVQNRIFAVISWNSRTVEHGSQELSRWSRSQAPLEEIRPGEAD